MEAVIIAEDNYVTAGGKGVLPIPAPVVNLIIICGINQLLFQIAVAQRALKLS